ncbi:MAG: NTP transferase domain-containing protein [Myxococcota bacterium]|nr:NTP transferase domain-containing protein [Myxococcota bacterium]
MSAGRLSPAPVAEGRFEAVSAALLTGGASTRMGTDKSRLELDGVPLATTLARGLEGLVGEVLLIGGDPPPDAPGRRVRDPEGPRCALRGVVAALEAATREKVFVVATDMPGLNAELLLALLAWPEADVVLPRTDRGPEPLCALYRREPAARRARARLESGELALRGLLAGLRVEELSGEDLARVDPDGLGLANVNTPEELEQFRSAAAASDRGARW